MLRVPVFIMSALDTTDRVMGSSLPDPLALVLGPFPLLEIFLRSILTS
jgi:hypothetical protein